MANPQCENGYTPIANEILENLVKLPLNGTQFRIVIVVWRFTYGFSRKEHEISETFLMKALGLKRTQLRQIKRELSALIECKIITVVREADFNKTRALSFNKNYDEWCLKSHQVTNKTPGDELDTSPGDGLVTQENNNKTIIKQMRIDPFFESLWSLYPNKKGKSKVSTKQKKILFDEYGEEKLKAAIRRYSEEVKSRDPKYIMHGSTFFNGGFQDYLPAETPNTPGIAKRGKIVVMTDEQLEGFNNNLLSKSQNSAGKNRIQYIDEP